jgi:hypothetical protein
LAVHPPIVDEKFGRRHGDMMLRRRGQYRCHEFAPF